MKDAFDKLKKISIEYKSAVDALAPDYEYKTKYAADHLYNDDERTRRVLARNDDFNGQIGALAQRARENAAPVITELREAVKEYITTSTDTATLATLQGLIAAGVTLTDTEITAFAQKGGYGVLRMLEKASAGHIKAPSPEAYEKELADLEHYFRDIGAYRGGLASISTDRPWGQSPATGNAIMGGMIENFPTKLDGMARRWAVLEC